MNNSSDALLQSLEVMSSEARNPSSMDIDQMDTLGMLQIINNEDKKVARSLTSELANIAKAVDAAVVSLKAGGRLIYIGAGTSGRLGILDAVECRPTFSVADDVVVGIIAGGEKALIHAVEGAEDNAQQGEVDVKAISLQPHDTLVGIAASGRTPYVIGALKYATSIGCSTVSIVCNPNAPMLALSPIGICANVGPECLTGSTRMKSGTAQKLILNMISTASMIQLGKVYENLMVDVNATNEKLRARAIRIVMQATNCSRSRAQAALEQAQQRAKLAILMILTNTTSSDAEKLLASSDDHLRNAIKTNAL